MDQIVFQHDTVLSDVHMHLPNTRRLMTRLNTAAQPAALICPVFMSRFKILAGRREEEDAPEDGGGALTPAGQDVEAGLDEDGDLDITRRPRRPPPGGGRALVCPVILQRCSPELEEEEGGAGDEEDGCSRDTIRIEHTMATSLEDVGKQVWRGALLLADFILSTPETFRGATVLELGAGTGLTSVVMATAAKRVYCTDVGEDLLKQCDRNMALNEHMMEPSGGQVRVRQLDWMQHSLCTDADVDFSWTEEEVADLYDNTSFIIAADVCYDDDLTDGFFRTLYRLCSSFSHTCAVFISIEKRLNFSLRDLDVCCPAYDRFLRCLSQIPGFRADRVPPTFAQFLLYERVEQLELWRLTATPPPAVSLTPPAPS